MFKYIFLIFSIGCFSSDLESRVSGLVLGSFYGDAYSGPFEFKEYHNHSEQLFAYSKPASPFSTYLNFAPAGTITDDSRHKLILLELIKKNNNFKKSDLALAYIKKYEITDQFTKLRQSWLKQFYQLAHYQLDSRSKNAKPGHTFFSGIPTILGQMIFSPIAKLYPGKQDLAYHKCVDINFFDQATAIDVNCSIVAALAQTLGQPSPSFETFFNSLKNFDPYNMAKNQFTGRPLFNWLNQAIKISNSHKKDRNFLKALKSQLKAKYWWEDYTGLIITISILHRTQRHPMKAFSLINKLGKDSDSYSQLAGAILGSIHGIELFPTSEIDLIKKRISEQFKLDINNFI